MVEFLTTHGTTARIEDLISRARERIVLISPFLYWSQILYQRLREADRRGIRIVFVYGKKDLDVEQRRLLDELENLSLYFCPNLHAKCYFNEQQLIISSLNLIEFSERHNREMSVLFTRGESVYRDAVAESQSILAASTLERGADTNLVENRPSRPRATLRPEPHVATATGLCIRCGTTISFNPKAPYCHACYGVWMEYQNWDYEEKWCHKCGADSNTTMRRPLCAACF